MQRRAEPGEQSWQGGDFGKYGIGLFTLFKFGPDVTIQIDSKQAAMRERMVSARIDYRTMRNKDRFEIERIANPPVDAGVFPEASSQGTRILISSVAEQFWDSNTQASPPRLKAALLAEMSEKYSMYTHGMAPIRDVVLRCRDEVRAELLANVQDPELGMDALPRIDILVDGESVLDTSTNRVIQRMRMVAGVGQADAERAGDVDGDDEGSRSPGPALGAGEPDEDHDGLSQAQTQGGAGSGGAGDDTGASCRGATGAPADAGRPCWYTVFKVKTRAGTSAANVHVRRVASGFPGPNFPSTARRCLVFLVKYSS